VIAPRVFSHRDNQRWLAPAGARLGSSSASARHRLSVTHRAERCGVPRAIGAGLPGCRAGIGSRTPVCRVALARCFGWRHARGVVQAEVRTAGSCGRLFTSDVRWRSLMGPAVVTYNQSLQPTSVSSLRSSPAAAELNRWASSMSAGFNSCLRASAGSVPWAH
jgi:hypothetical protein